MPKRNQAGQRRKRGWKQWTSAQARRAVAAWRRSGLPLGTFARQQGIEPGRLRWWRNRLSGEPPAAWKERETPARLVPAVVTAPLVALGAAAVSIRFSAGAVVEIASVHAVPPEWVGELLAAATRASR